MSRQKITTQNVCDNEDCPGHPEVTYGPEGMVMVVTDDPQRPLAWEVADKRHDGPFNYVPTHLSVKDGSHAMQVSDHLARFTLINEDGYYWQADPAEWEAIDA